MLCRDGRSARRRRRPIIRQNSEAREISVGRVLEPDRGTGAGEDSGRARYDALGNLSYLAGMLKQAVRQSVRPVLLTYDAGRLRIDGKGLGAADVAIDLAERQSV